jgi:hypothetical protein
MKLELFKRKENGDPKIVDERELHGYLVQGWDVQTVLQWQDSYTQVNLALWL